MNGGLIGGCRIGAGLVAALLLLAACGVKAPPLPPKRLPPAPVSDLPGEMAGDLMRLAWSIPAESGDAGEAVGFVVYRSKTPLDEAECRDCPLTFVQAARISVTPSDRQSGRMRFAEPLEKGYRYRYKMRAYDTFGAAGEDSNTLTVDY